MTETASTVRPTHGDRVRVGGQNTRRALHVPLLLGTLIVATVFGAAVYAWREYQVGRIATSFLERADNLEREGDLALAARYLYRYVQVHPNDADARARLAETFDRSQADPWRAINLYYQALGVAARERKPELRLKLTELLLNTRRFASAEAEALQLLEVANDAELEQQLAAVEEGSAQVDPKALRLTALALYGQWQSGAMAASLERVVTLGRVLESALKSNAGDVELSSRLSHLYRVGDYPRKDGRPLELTRRAQLADAVMDQMIDAHSENPEAYLVRYQYRVTYGMAEADADLNEALRCGPDNLAVLLAAGQHAQQEFANSASRSRSLDEARQYYQRAIQVAPSDVRGFLGLGNVHLAAGNPNDAADAWKQGLRSAAQEDVNLNLCLADVLTAQGQLDEAEKCLAVLDRAVIRLATTANRAQRSAVERLVSLVRAKWLVRKGKPADAIPLLGRVTAGQMSSPTETAQGQQAWLLLGELYGHLRQWDRSAVAYEAAARLQPDAAEPRMAAAAAWRAAGRPEMAAAHYERALAIADSAETWLLLAQTRLQQQSRLPDGQRNWDLFHLALEEAGSPKRTPPLENAWRLELLKVDHALAQAPGKAEGAVEGGRELKTRLDAIQSRYADSPALLQALVVSYQRLGYPGEADRTLKRLESLSDQPVMTCLLRSRLHLLRKEYAQAQEVLRSGIATLPSQWHRPLEYELARISLEQGNLQEAHAQLVKLFESNASNLEMALQLTELAFESNDFDEVKIWEEKLRGIEGSAGSYWRYSRARRLLGEAKSVQDRRFAEAVELQAQLEGQRPAWPAPHLLAGIIAQRKGNLQQAIEAYEQAVRLGEERVAVYEQLISLLYRAQRFVEAEQYLSRLQSQMPLSQNLSLLEISVAAKQGQLDRAIQSARRSLQRRPDDVMAQVWLGQLLLATEATEEAESTLLGAVRQAPKDMRAYNGLFTFYLRTKNSEQAEETLQALAANAELTEPQRALALAQGYDSLGENDKALANYREAERLAPKDVAIQRRLAGFLLQRDPVEAEKTLRKILVLEPDLDAARRALAAILAKRGGELEWQEALQLLRQSGADRDVSALDRRLQALLLARRGGKENLVEARRLLERLVADPNDTVAGDRLLLARLYETEGKLQAARQQYLALVGKPDPSIAHLALFIDLLLRQEQSADADRWLKTLEQIAPDNLGTVSLRSRWLRAEGRTSEIEPLVESLAAALEKHLDEQGQPKTQLCQSVGNVYSAVEEYPAAERWYRRLADLDATRYGQLAIALAKQGRASESVQICKTAATADASSRPAAVLAGALLSGRLEEKDLREAEAIFAKALEEHADDAVFLAQLANVRVVQDRADDAVALYRRVLVLKPKDVLALNNLATLLSQSEDARDEAIRYIDQAIEFAGPQAPLLDTKGMIYVCAGKGSEGVAWLQEAASVPGADPRFHFHLAVGYYRLGQIDKARQAFDKACDGGLRDQILTQSDRGFLEQLEETFPQ